MQNTLSFDFKQTRAGKHVAVLRHGRVARADLAPVLWLRIRARAIFGPGPVSASLPDSRKQKRRGSNVMIL
jgi:hypothetical protein